MALLRALLSQALGRLWGCPGHSPGHSPGHAPPSRAMEHDRAIEVYGAAGHTWKGQECQDIIRTIRDPEKPNTLEELEVVTEGGVEVQEIGEEEYLVVIRFTPTVPHCSLATLIVNKQINDKERVAAAMENPTLREIVEQCVTEPE